MRINFLQVTRTYSRTSWFDIDIMRLSTTLMARVRSVGNAAVGESKRKRFRQIEPTAATQGRIQDLQVRANQDTIPILFFLPPNAVTLLLPLLFCRFDSNFALYIKRAC